MSDARSLASKRVLVLGLGRTGVAVAEVLASLGASVFASEAGEVTPSDREALTSAGIEVESEGHTRASSQIDDFDIVVPSPGISPVRGLLHTIVERGMTVWSELELGGRLTDARTVAVTGTNGKTTVVRLIEHMARAGGLDAYACGNLETKFVTAAADHPDADLFVVEAPSFVLTFCPSFRPDVAIVTSLAPDHLDWHGTFEHYRDAKAQIAAHQGRGNLFLYPSAQPELEAFAISDAAAEGPARQAFGGGSDRYARFAARGPHFAADADAATRAATFLGIGDDAIDEALATFEFDAHRLAPVGTLDGVAFIDDAVSANPLATLAALRSFDVPVVLIAGGRNKGSDLGVLAGEAQGVRSVVAIGEAADEIEQAFATSGVFVGKAASMREAVSMAMDRAQPGDVVLLSPACASWDMFNGYADRGRTFVEACREAGVS